MSEPWKCPECSTWLAPHVSEHRCDPPTAGVTALPYIGDPPGSCGTGISTTTLPGAVTFNVTGSAVSEQELTRAVQNGLLRLSANSARVRWGLPGAA
jgi:hypothetical protein